MIPWWGLSGFCHTQSRTHLYSTRRCLLLLWFHKDLHQEQLVCSGFPFTGESIANYFTETILHGKWIILESLPLAARQLKAFSLLSSPRIASELLHQKTHMLLFSALVKYVGSHWGSMKQSSGLQRSMKRAQPSQGQGHPRGPPQSLAPHG